MTSLRTGGSEKKKLLPIKKPYYSYLTNHSLMCLACDPILPSPCISVICFREEGMIHFSHAKKLESRLFPDWIGNNTDDLRCFDWLKRRHPLVVVDFSLHFASVMSS